MKSQEKTNSDDFVNFHAKIFLLQTYIIISINSQKNGFSYQVYNKEIVVFDFEFKDAYKSNGKSTKKILSF